MSRPSESSLAGGVRAEPYQPARTEAQLNSNLSPQATLASGVGAKLHQDSSLPHLRVTGELGLVQGA